MAVDVANDGTSGVMHIAVFETAYDVIVLDRDLPGTHGDAVCTQRLARPRPRPACSC